MTGIENGEVCPGKDYLGGVDLEKDGRRIPAEAERINSKGPGPCRCVLLWVAVPATLFLSLLSGMAYLTRIHQQLLDVTPEGGLLC